ncbi:hypothetical protein [Leptospira interrogans]|nr:hypothetical protein [Leptospira interrogans]
MGTTTGIFEIKTGFIIRGANEYKKIGFKYIKNYERNFEESKGDTEFTK